MSGDKVHHAPLAAGQLAALRALVKPGGASILLADFPGVGGTAMSRALAGLPVRAATRELIRLGLERLAAQRAVNEGAARVVDATVIPAEPVCPRCLDIELGTPGGTPEEPHPGPFTEDLCAACHKAIDASLEPEERAEARRVRAAREKAVKP